MYSLKREYEKKTFINIGNSISEIGLHNNSGENKGLEVAILYSVPFKFLEYHLKLTNAFNISLTRLGVHLCSTEAVLE